MFSVLLEDSLCPSIPYFHTVVFSATCPDHMPSCVNWKQADRVNSCFLKLENIFARGEGILKIDKINWVSSYKSIVAKTNAACTSWTVPVRRSWDTAWKLSFISHQRNCHIKTIIYKKEYTPCSKIFSIFQEFEFISACIPVA